MVEDKVAEDKLISDVENILKDMSFPSDAHKEFTRYALLKTKIFYASKDNLYCEEFPISVIAKKPQHLQKKVKVGSWKEVKEVITYRKEEEEELTNALLYGGPAAMVETLVKRDFSLLYGETANRKNPGK